MNELLQNRHTIEAELREALRRTDQLSVDFQPLFGAGHTRIIGAEALARWRHPQLGQVSPAHFIPVAEATGLIGANSATFVLQPRACELGATWPGRIMAVNISPAQLRDPNFPQRVFTLLTQTRMRPMDLELEITEGILLEDAGRRRPRRCASSGRPAFGCRPRRFRHRLFLAQLPQALPRRSHQDRSLFRQPAGAAGAASRSPSSRPWSRARPRPQDRGDRRRCVETARADGRCWTSASWLQRLPGLPAVAAGRAATHSRRCCKRPGTAPIPLQAQVA